MYDLRRSFVSELDTTFDTFLATHAVIAFGYERFSDHAKAYPDASYSIGIGHPATASRLRIGPNHLELLKLFDERRDAFIELFHDRLLRSWHDFLAEVYRILVAEFFEGKRSSLEVPGGNIRLPPDDALRCDPVAAITSSYVSTFQFAKSIEQMRTIEKLVNVNLQPEVKLTLRKHIIVRNCFEHSVGGVVRDVDTRELGRTGIELTDNAGKPRTFYAGEPLVLTVWDLEDLAEALRHLANTITGD